MFASLPQTIPFTPAGFKAVVAEYDRLTQERPNILIRLQAAREMGDLSENGAYKAARFELSDTDRRLRHLGYLKHMGRITPPQPTDRVAFGHQVTLKTKDQEIIYTLVNQYESNPQKHLLSVDSPIGQALLGKKVGDTVKVAAPAGTMIYTIIRLI